MNTSTYLGGSLIVSALFLSSLVPGGPIENRDFTHINPIILIAFNLCLTALAFSSFILGYRCMRGCSNYLVILFAGASYFLVYALDLLGLFPISPTPMSHALWAVEVSGLLIAIPLILMSVCHLKQEQVTKQAEIVIPWRFLLPLGFVVVLYASIVTIYGGTQL